MKIIFKHLSGYTLELEGITSDTLLRDIKRFYESKTNQVRHHYRFCINGKAGNINDNSLMKFSDYLQLVHNKEFEQDTTLQIHSIMNLGNNQTIFTNRVSRPQRADDVSNLVCGITLEAIRGMPVKINNRFYDQEAFVDYLIHEQDRYFRATESGYNYVPICPLRQPLPPNLIRAVKFPLHPEDIELRKGDFSGLLMYYFSACIEDYEDELRLLNENQSSINLQSPRP